jgi:hypothetical protein
VSQQSAGRPGQALRAALRQPQDRAERDRGAALRQAQDSAERDRGAAISGQSERLEPRMPREEE